MADTGVRAMPSHHYGLVVETVNSLFNRTDNLIEVTARQIGAAYAALKQCITGNQGFILFEVKTNRSWSVPGSMDSHPTAAAQILIILQIVIRIRQLDRRYANARIALPQYPTKTDHLYADR